MGPGDKQDIRNKMENLDSELDTFFRSVRELKELRDMVGELPEKLLQGLTELEGQKKEMKKLMVSTQNLFTELEDHAKDILMDMEKKSNAMKGEMRSDISHMDEAYREEFERLRNEHRDRFAEISRKMRSFDKFDEVFIEERIQEILRDKHAGGNNLIWLGIIILLVCTAIAVAAFFLR